MKYNLPMPPQPEHEVDTLTLMAQLDQYALQDVPTQIALVADLPLATIPALLDDLERTRAEHEARARNVESAASILRDHLHATGNHNIDSRPLVSMAEHVGRGLPTAPAMRAPLVTDGPSR